MTTIQNPVANAQTVSVQQNLDNKAQVDKDDSNKETIFATLDTDKSGGLSNQEAGINIDDYLPVTGADNPVISSAVEKVKQYFNSLQDMLIGSIKVDKNDQQAKQNAQYELDKKANTEIVIREIKLELFANKAYNEAMNPAQKAS